MNSAAAASPEFLDALAAAVGVDHVLKDAPARYHSDSTFVLGSPLCVVLPGTTEEVAAVVRAGAAAGVAVVARGSGTSFSGGPVALGPAMVVSLERLTRLQMHPADTCATAGAGVITADIQAAAAEQGLMYPPDPASVGISTIGGNVACNAGGMACLKYGVTADYVIGMTVVLASGAVLELGGRLRKRASGYRLAQLFVGSEGTLGIVTEVILKLIPLPRHHATAMVGFGTLESAAAAVARLLAAGILPAALELMDRGSRALVADLIPPRFGADLEAVLIVEQDGSDPAQVASELARGVAVLGGDPVVVALTAAERDALWSSRRQLGLRVIGGPHLALVEDVGVPISQIPAMVRRTADIAARHGVRVAVAGHAGDGNLHPQFLFQEGDRARSRRPPPTSCWQPSSSVARSPRSTAWAPSSATSPPPSTDRRRST